ncbi:hypothetical protein ACWPM1_07630 [Tsuneonella sp. HG249]
MQPHSSFPGVFVGYRNGVGYILHPATSQGGTAGFVLHYYLPEGDTAP